MSSMFSRLIKKVFSVNPALVESTLKFGEYRYPPGSFKNEYNPDKGPADKIAKNYYYDRDLRRSYPQTVVYKQEDLSNMLLSSPFIKEDKNLVATENPEDNKAPLDQVIKNLDFSKQPSASFLPPIPRKRYHYTISDENYEMEADKYWPIYLVK